jgi:hypothetical protein
MKCVIRNSSNEIRNEASCQRIEVFMSRFRRYPAGLSRWTIPSRREALCMSFYDVLAEMYGGVIGDSRISSAFGLVEIGSGMSLWGSD